MPREYNTGRFPQEESLTEYERERRSLRMAGLLEIGASMILSQWKFSRGLRDYHYIFPYIGFNDNNPLHIERLKAVFGGGTRHDKGESWHWSVNRKQAYNLALTVRPYTPSRSTIINIFMECENPQATLIDRISLLHQSRLNPVRDSVDIKEYEDLVLKPEFLAGVIDGRGVYSRSRSNQDDTIPYHQIEVTSGNESLLRALQNIYGGTLILKYEQGNKAEIQGSVITVRNNAYVWRTKGVQAVQLSRIVEPHVLFHKASI